MTYRDLGVQVFDDINFPNFAQLDYVLMLMEWRHVVLDLASTRNVQLRSQHFLLYGVFDVQVQKESMKKERRLDMSLLKDDEIIENFRDGI